MFVPKPYRVDSEKAELAAKLIAGFPLATLISYGDAGLQITKVPVIVKDSKIYGHLATRNPHCAYLKDPGTNHRLLMDGPHGFISPRYLGNRGHDIPTWNYVAAVVASKVEVIQEGSEIVDILAAQLRAYDGQDVSYLNPEETAGIEHEILIFSLELSDESIVLKQKLSQNRSDDDFAMIIENLKESGQTQLADWMITARPAIDPKPS